MKLFKTIISNFILKNKLITYFFDLETAYFMNKIYFGNIICMQHFYKIY